MKRLLITIATVVAISGCTTNYSKKDFDTDATDTVGYAANVVTENLPEANSAEVCKGNPNYIQVPWGSWLTSDGDDCILKASWDWTFHTAGADPHCPDAGTFGCRGPATNDPDPSESTAAPAAAAPDPAPAPEGGEMEGVD